MDTKMPYLIIINGAPGVGKTTLAKRLHKDLAIGLVTKDAFKEFLFDTVGADDRDWSFALGKEAIDFCYHFTKFALQHERSVIFESAFWPEHAKRDVEQLIQETGVRALEIYCTVTEETRHQRFNERIESGERHHGHADSPITTSDGLEKYGPLDVCQRVDVDTGEFYDEAYTDLLNVIKKFAKGE